ncbi:unnamed protein product [Ostreobium quekettii]|uniref:Uncharacterized protein n=1 Tax=Ostreobium quekettii TaxID=121088 RepID=A0A8S1J6K5_9CHLO|nr:unnamed protein product [Ostreobium quekettii]
MGRRPKGLHAFSGSEISGQKYWRPHPRPKVVIDGEFGAVKCLVFYCTTTHLGKWRVGNSPGLPAAALGAGARRERFERPEAGSCDLEIRVKRFRDGFVWSFRRRV